MTTIIATKEGVWGDTKCGCNVNFKTQKIFRIGSSVVGGCGGLANIYRFVEYMKTGEKPEWDDESGFEAIEVKADGMWCWDKELVPLKIREKYYAVGSGAQYAIGAMDAGATPKAAMLIVSKRDDSTNAQIEFLSIKGDK